jgi:hypothetical protein
MEGVRRTWLQEPGARWPGVPISIGASLAALALNARPRRSRAGRLGQRLASLGAAISWANLFSLRFWQQTWGASEEEVHRAMPGDALVTRPLMVATRGITIEAPAFAVWPWLVQMGLGRAGFYSYDWLDNAGAPSADRIIPEFQNLKVGDTVPTSRSGGFTVEAMEPERFLVLVIRDRGRPIVTVVGQVDPLGPRRSRLVFRVRMRPSLRPSALLLYLGMDFGEVLMMRKMLLGIQQRAERERAPAAPASAGA